MLIMRLRLGVNVPINISLGPVGDPVEQDSVRAEHGYAQSKLGCHDKLIGLQVKLQRADGRSNQPGPSIWKPKGFQPG